jgi:hypothetical protein
MVNIMTGIFVRSSDFKNSGKAYVNLHIGRRYDPTTCHADVEEFVAVSTG